MGRRLKAHDHGVVAARDGPRAEDLLVDLHHGVQRVDPAGDHPGLHAVLFERQRERDAAAGADAGRRRADHLVGDQVQRADLVLRAPPPPVVDALGDQI